jgi:hypothetical protein
MAEGQQGERRGGVDATTVLYILGGIPAMVGFFVVLFTLVKWFGIPA